MPTRIGPAPGSSPPFAESRSSPEAGPTEAGAHRTGDDAAVTTPMAPAPHSAPPSADAHRAHARSVDELPVDPHPDGSVPADLGGYRLVRMLGRSSRATTAIVHGEGVTLVARVFGVSCPPGAIDAEVAVHDALRRADGAVRDHTAVADDLVTLDDGRLALLSPHVAGPRLDDLLALRRGALDLGEAITLLAPLAIALEAAHAAGVTGLGLGPRAVRLSASGAPVIVRLHDAQAGPALPDRFRAREPVYAADAAALDHLAGAVAASVLERDRPALLAALRAPALGRPLAPALFDLAEPRPVRMGTAQPIGDHRVPAPLGIAGSGDWADREDTAGLAAERGVRRVPLPAVPGASAANASVAPGRRPTWLSAGLDALRSLGLPSGVIETVQNAAEWLIVRAGRFARDAGSRARAGMRGAVAAPPAVPPPGSPPAPSDRADRSSSIRPRFVLAGAAGATALVMAIVVAGGPSGPTDGAAPALEPRPTATPAPGADREPVGDTRGGPLAAAEDAPETVLHPEPEQWQGIVDALVGRWSACRASAVDDAAADDAAADDCGRVVAHAGSAAERLLLIDDARHAVLDRWRTVRGDAVVIERMGGAVLIDLVTAGTTTASLLVVRSEAGWRIRDVIA